MNKSPVKKYDDYIIKSLEEFKKTATYSLKTYYDLPYILTHSVIFVCYDNNTNTYDVFDTKNKTVCFINLEDIEHIKNIVNIFEDVPNVFELSSTIDFEIVGLTNTNKIPIEIKIETKSNKNLYKIIQSYKNANNIFTINNTCIFMYLSLL
jgi:hypothetical protein